MTPDQEVLIAQLISSLVTATAAATNLGKELEWIRDVATPDCVEEAADELRHICAEQARQADLLARLTADDGGNE